MKIWRLAIDYKAIIKVCWTHETDNQRQVQLRRIRRRDDLTRRDEDAFLRNPDRGRR